MLIDWQLWKKPEVGGVLLSLGGFVLICVMLLVKTLSRFESVKSDIAVTSSKMHWLDTQIEAVDTYEKLHQQEAQKFATFKRKKWNLPLTQDRINHSLYTLQKQANVEFLSIQFQPLADSNNIAKATVTLTAQVLRAQSFFSFLHKLETELPGIVKIKHFELKRARELNAQLAQKVSEGQKVSLFEGAIELEIEYAQFT